MIPIPWLLLRRRPMDTGRWRAAGLSATLEGAAGWREDRYDGLARGVGPVGFARVRDAMLSYSFFPPDRLTGVVDTPDELVAPGATIVQRVHVAMMGFESGTRVLAMDAGVDEGGRRFVHFTYATLVGHPERGVATFSAAETSAGDVVLGIVTRSRAAAWWARLGGPLTRALQLQTNRRVVARLVAIAEGEPLA